MRRLAVWVIFLVMVLAGPVEAWAADRVALVIGNGKYAHTAELPNPPNDAQVVAAALKEIGFDVETGIDLGYDAMQRVLRSFLTKSAKARVALFYYAGHGIQSNGRNYLIPVDAKLSSASDLNFGTVELDKILASLDEPQRASIIILDACRDNPLARSFALASRSASVGSGLAAYTALGTGSLIVFATAPGKVALDGRGKNSPFTESLVKHLRTPGLEVRQMLTRVRNDVAKATDDRQIPWDNSSLRGDVYLAGTPSASGAVSNANDELLSSLQKRIAELEQQRKVPATTQSEKVAALQQRLQEMEERFRQQSSAAEKGRQEYSKDKTAKPVPADSTDSDFKSAAIAPSGKTDTPASQREGDPLVTECDRLAAMPHDEQAIVEGVKLEKIDAEKALKACRSAVEKHPDSLRLKFQLGRSLAQYGEYDKAIRIFRETADKGYAAAMMAMAYMLYNGYGVEKDRIIAAGWLTQAAQSGSARSVAMLGYMYRTGDGVEKNIKKALELYRRAADKGDGYGIAQLAHLTFHGEGTRKNRAEAIRLFRRASEMGEPEAMGAYGYLQATGDGVRRNCKKGVELLRKAAEENNSDALGYLADLHYSGRCLKQDDALAASYWIEAIQAGNQQVAAILEKRHRLLRRSFKVHLQRLLKEQQVYDGPIDGSVGAGTIRALAKLREIAP